MWFVLPLTHICTLLAADLSAPLFHTRCDTPRADRLLVSTPTAQYQEVDEGFVLEHLFSQTRPPCCPPKHPHALFGHLANTSPITPRSLVCIFAPFWFVCFTQTSGLVPRAPPQPLSLPPFVESPVRAPFWGFSFVYQLPHVLRLPSFYHSHRFDVPLVCRLAVKGIEGFAGSRGVGTPHARPSPQGWWLRRQGKTVGVRVRTVESTHYSAFPNCCQVLHRRLFPLLSHRNRATSHCRSRISLYINPSSSVVSWVTSGLRLCAAAFLLVAFFSLFFFILPVLRPRASLPATLLPVLLITSASSFAFHPRSSTPHHINSCVCRQSRTHPLSIHAHTATTGGVLCFSYFSYKIKKRHCVWACRLLCADSATFSTGA